MIKKILSPMLLLSAAAIWGFAFAAQDAASAVPVFTMGAMRSILAALFLLCLSALMSRFSPAGLRTGRGRLRFTRVELIGGAIAGVILTGATALQQSGINAGTDGGKAGFITALYVTLVPVYAIFIGRRTKLNIWLGVAIAAVGFYFLCIKENFSIEASDLFVIFSALSFPLHILVIDRFSPRCDGVRFSCVQFFVCAIANTLLALILERGTDAAVLTANLLPIIYLGVCSSGIAYTLQIIGQRNADPSAASVILSLESVFAVIGTAIFLHHELTPREYLGCAIILVAVLISQLDFSAILKRLGIGARRKSRR